MAAATNGVDITPFITAPELKKFQLSEVEQTGKTLEIGHYGEVEELIMAGQRVTGKRLLLCSSGGSLQVMLKKFISECELLYKLQHSNIVHFYGLCFLPIPQTHTETLQPVMVIEHIENDLYHLLDTQANLELTKKVSILLDISTGLMYLHSTHVVHMDLTSCNILLTETLQAKISNLGKAQYLESSRSRVRNQSVSTPGTLVYMPPEAGSPKAQCSTEIDIFSFGVIMLHTITQVFPGDLPAPKYTEDGTKKSKVKMRTEIERRGPYLEIAQGQLGEDHILLKLICSCLENLPKDRPTAKSIVSSFQTLFMNKDEIDYDQTQKVTLRRRARFDGTAEGRSAMEKEHLRIKHQSMSFMHTHVLHGHPSVLFKLKQGGGFVKRRATGDWQQFVFKIVDNRLQCLTLKEKLQNEIQLKDVKDVKARRSPNNNTFPFFVHFEGKDSPWILSANSNEERRCWMEAIKPGSTFDQWADPFQLDEGRRRAHTIALPPQSSTDSEATVHDQLTSSQPDVQSDSSVAATIQEQSSSCEDTNIEIKVRTPTPPPRSKISLRYEPYDPYVSANEVLLPLGGSWRSSDHLPPVADDMGSKDEADACAESTYLKLLPQPEPSVSEFQSPKHHIYSTIVDTQRTYEIVAELEEEFTPLEIDLLVKMLEKVSAKAKSDRKKKRRRKSADDSALKDRPEKQMMPTFSTDDSSGPYIQLADLVQDLNELEPAGILSEQNLLSMLSDGDRANKETSQGIRRAHRSGTSPSYISESHGSYTSRPTSLHHENLLKGSLFRQNAVRQRHDTVSHSKPKETVNHLRTLLRRANSEDFLEDEDEFANPVWSRADAKETDTLHLLSPATNEKRVFISNSDLHNLVQIEEGQYGPVYKATLSQTFSVDVTVKPIGKSLSKRIEFNSYLHELNILVENRHPNVSQIYGIVSDTMMIVMRYFPLGNLKTFLNNHSSPIDQLMKYMLDIAIGMHHITEKLQLVHRNLAAHNVFITEQKICQVADMDIGLTNTIANVGYSDPSKTRWMAPESLLRGQYSAASDVWSYGVTIWEILYPSSVPYGDCDAKQCREQITKGFMLAISQTCPHKLGKIIRACWSQSPSKRPSFIYISHLLSSHQDNKN